MTPPGSNEGFSDQPPLDGELQLPFRRWLIKLVVEKLLAPVIVPAATAAATAATGWYVVGQYQVKDQVEQEVRVREGAREIVEDYADSEEDLDVDAALEELRGRWAERYDEEPPQGLMAQQEFPEEIVKEHLERAAKKK